MKNIVQQFISLLEEGQIGIYNEFSLQHEFGIHLRHELPGMKVQFERNVSSLFESTSHFIKKEIDITVYSADMTQQHCAFELKFPRNGQYPEQMFSFCKDIAFAEQLKAAGFSKTYFLVFVEDKLFYEGATEGIYAYFRGSCPLSGSIQKPTGRKNEAVVLSGNYIFNWSNVGNGMKYALVET